MRGIYVLIISVAEPIRTGVGALGELAFPAGLYAYVGSAQNNLELRVARHKRKNKRLFWHIDYLLNHDDANVVDVYYKLGDKSMECRLADVIAQKAGPIAGFGCSDCQCTSHLFYSGNFDFLDEYASKLPQ